MGDKNCYPGTNVLINNYNIRDKELLDKLEIQKATIKFLQLDRNPNRIKFDTNEKCLKDIHKFLFHDIYPWSGEFRKENLYKSEMVLSGASAEYSYYKQIRSKLKSLFQKMKTSIDKQEINGDMISDFLSELWNIHPFREGNTRTCITFIWLFLYNHGIFFNVELFRNNPKYVRNSLVMANYDEYDYLKRIVNDAFDNSNLQYVNINDDETFEKYQISKRDYETFKEKYSIK